MITLVAIIVAAVHTLAKACRALAAANAYMHPREFRACDKDRTCAVELATRSSERTLAEEISRRAHRRAASSGIGFVQSSSTRREFSSDTTAIFFVSPRSLVRNTDFSARRRTTWWNGKVTSIRVFAFRFTVCTANIASRLRKC